METPGTDNCSSFLSALAVSWGRGAVACFLAGVNPSRPFLFCPPDSDVLCNGVWARAGRGGRLVRGWMPSASRVHRGRLKIEQQMLFSKSPFDSCQKQLHMDFFFFIKDYLWNTIASKWLYRITNLSIHSFTCWVFIEQLLSSRVSFRDGKRGSHERPGPVVVDNFICQCGWVIWPRYWANTSLDVAEKVSLEEVDI